MIAWFKNWYYGEDGMKPIYRTRRFHKVLIALLVADLRYRAKVRRSNPEMLRKGRPVHRDLTK